jgi:Site-specific recombinase XerD
MEAIDIESCGSCTIRKCIGKRLASDGSWQDNFKMFSGDSYEDAEQNYLMWEKDCYGFDISLTLGELLDKYIYDIMIDDPDIRYNTKYGYIITYKQYFKDQPITRIPLNQIRAIDLQFAYNSLRCKPRYIRSINFLIGKLYNFLQLRFEIPNISQAVTIPKAPSVPRCAVEVWTDEELETITKNLDTAPRIRFLIILLINTGCRISELLALKYNDIDINAKTLLINKQLQKYTDFKDKKKSAWYGKSLPKSDESNRIIPLSDDVLAEFKIHRKWHRKQMKEHGYLTDYIFTTGSGHVIDYRSETLTFRRYYKRIDVQYRSYHVYRHTFGTNLCKCGIPIQVASKLLGHSSVNITAKYYVHIDNQQKIQAINSITMTKH